MTQRLSGLDGLLTMAVWLGAGPDISVQVQRYCSRCDGRLPPGTQPCPHCVPAERTTMQLHVYKSDCDWVVATSVQDAWDTWCTHTGESKADYDEYDDFVQEPDDKPLTIWGDVGFENCDCKATLAAYQADTQKKIDMINKQPEIARAPMFAALPKAPPTHPNGHLESCDLGATTKTCAEWVAENGPGFLASTEY
jgi:hypothetical protein